MAADLGDLGQMRAQGREPFAAAGADKKARHGHLVDQVVVLQLARTLALRYRYYF